MKQVLKETYRDITLGLDGLIRFIKSPLDIVKDDFLKHVIGTSQSMYLEQRTQLHVCLQEIFHGKSDFPMFVCSNW